MIDIPSPAIAIVGRHNSGKTTLVEKLIAHLTASGLDVGSIKHHHHGSFDIDIPGKDSYRHRAAGATETVIASPDLMARMKTMDHELECAQIVETMPGHDIIVVEGYRKSGLPTIEIMRAANEADVAVAEAFLEGAKDGASLGTDFIQLLRGEAPEINSDFVSKMPTASTVALVSDIPEAQQAAALYNIPVFELDAVDALAAFLEEYYVRPKISVVIQAGGESRRMGQSKALVPFQGRPLIQRIVERLAPVADELIITTNESDKLEFLHSYYPELNLRLVTDLHKERGALPGLHTALSAASNPLVAVVACDMIFASPRLVVAEAIAIKESKSDIVVPVNKHGFEPFHALYRKETCLPAIEELVSSGHKRAQAFFDAMKVRNFTQTEVLRAEPRGGCFINANTPEELAAIEDTVILEA